MARSLTETLTEAAQSAVSTSNWERDQDAWNLPRAPGETIAPAGERDEPDVAKGAPGEPGAEPPAMSPDTTE
jgi:hypothetical protein